MKAFQAWLVSLSVAVVVALEPAVARAQAEGLALLDQVVAQRRAIKSGALELDAKGRNADGEVHFKVDLTFSGSDMRYDRVDYKPLLIVSRSGKAAVFRTVLAGDTFIQYSNQLADDGVDVVSVRGTRADAAGRLKRETFDPRILGLFALDVDALHMADLDSFSNTRENPPEVSTTEVELEGRTVTQVQLQFPKGAIRRYWVDPVQLSIVKAESRSSKPGGDPVDVTFSENQQSGGVWFPRAMRHERRVGGKVVTSLAVEVTGELNGAVEDSLFTLAGMDIPKGTRFWTVPSGPTEIWNGEQLVSSPLSEPHAEPGIWTSGWAWLTVGLLTLGVLLLVRGALKREPKD